MSAQTRAEPATILEPRYEERLILFIDFLGFKELVDRTSRDPALLARLLQAMDIVGAIGADMGPIFRSQRVTQFSDSVVVSYAVRERSAVFQLLTEIALAVVHLAELGFLVRGAVTSGPLYHSDRHVVGPAMNAAYLLESQAAIYPRVLIDETVLRVARGAPNPMHSADEEARYAQAYMTRDTDGRFYLDYVSWKSVVDVSGGTNDLYGEYLRKIGALVREGLHHQDPRVQAKFLWLRKKYVAALKPFREMSPDDPYRAENWFLCRAIARLPRYGAEAAAARKAVKAAQARSAKAG